MLHSVTFPGPVSSPDLVVLHGLLGSSRNWGLAAKALAEFATVHTLDLPGHGQSHTLPSLGFPGMADAVLEWLDAHDLSKPCLLGHSLGGKVAMCLASEQPQRLQSLVIADIAPRDYPPHSQEILEAMAAIDLPALQSRRDAEEALLEVVPDLGMRRFVLTNLVRDGQGFAWQADLHGLLRSLPQLSSNPMSGKAPFHGKALFIKGEKSGYIRKEDEGSIRRYFPDSTLHTVPGAGHNVHFDNVPAFTEILRSYLDV